MTRNDLMQSLIKARTDLVVNKAEPTGKATLRVYEYFLIKLRNNNFVFIPAVNLIQYDIERYSKDLKIYLVTHAFDII